MGLTLLQAVEVLAIILLYELILLAMKKVRL